MIVLRHLRPLTDLITLRASTSTRHSVMSVSPIAARRVARMRAASASFQSCRMWRSTHASPARGCGSVSAPHAHSQSALNSILRIMDSA